MNRCKYIHITVYRKNLLIALNTVLAWGYSVVEKNNHCLRKVLSLVAEGTDIKQTNIGDGGGNEKQMW